MADSERQRISATYRRFAAQEAHGRSPLYERLALGIAADPVAWADPHGASLAWIADRPGGVAPNRRKRS